jgi:hypothetical protein
MHTTLHEKAIPVLTNPSKDILSKFSLGERLLPMHEASLAGIARETSLIIPGPFPSCWELKKW